MLLAAAQEAERRPDGREEREAHLRKLLDADPQNNHGYEALAELELHAGRPEDAMKALRLGLERRPDDPDLLWNLTNLVIQLGSPEEGERLTARLAQTDCPRPRLDYLARPCGCGAATGRGRATAWRPSARSWPTPRNS